MHARKALAGVFAGSALSVVIATEASARLSGCLENGEIVTFDGVASAGAPAPDARLPHWVLNLSRPICVMRSTPFGRGASRQEISELRIIGTPPPLGAPLALTGKLLLGRSAPDTTLFVALEVIRGRRTGEAHLAAPPPSSVPPPASVPRPTQMAGAHCDAPPYGGTQAGYRDFVRRFARIVSPPKILAGICNAKFGRSPREGLHKLGFSDAKIDSENTEQLAADTLRALKSLVNTIE